MTENIILLALSVFSVVAGFGEDQEVRYSYHNSGAVPQSSGRPYNQAVVDHQRNPQGSLYSSPDKHTNYAYNEHRPVTQNQHQTHHMLDYIHNVPPAPEPSVSSYIATLSYGEGYPTIVYHCSLTDYKPVGASAVRGPNGHICTVSYHKPTVHAHDKAQSHPYNQESNKRPIDKLLEFLRPPEY